jgi:hypothetical protein
MAEGKRANYCTQFSFKNRVDDFYVMFLNKQTIKLDGYMSRDSAAVHLGRCEIMLKDLIAREPASNDLEITTKTKLMKGFASIFPITGAGNEVGIGAK